MTDLDLFQQLVNKAKEQTQSEMVQTLEKALKLIRGVPFITPKGRYWTWVGDNSHLSAKAECLIADTSFDLAKTLVGQQDYDKARWACIQGLLAVPLDENLTTLLTEVYMALGKPSSAKRLVESWGG